MMPWDRTLNTVLDKKILDVFEKRSARKKKVGKKTGSVDFLDVVHQVLGGAAFKAVAAKTQSGMPGVLKKVAKNPSVMAN